MENISAGCVYMHPYAIDGILPLKTTVVFVEKQDGHHDCYIEGNVQTTK